MNARRKHPRGFTLIEMMLAMGMGATVLLLLFVSLNIAIKAKRSGERTVTPPRMARIAIDLITRDLESVPPPNPNATPDTTTGTTTPGTTTNNNTTGIYLAGPFEGTAQGGNSGGEADVLDFYSIGEDQPPAQQSQYLSEGIRFIEIALKTDVDPPVLVRRVQRDLLSQQQSDPEEQVICRNVHSLTLRYFDGTDWYDTWDSTQYDNALPLAVQISLVIARDPANPKNGPTMTVVKTIPLACGVDQSQVQDTTTTQ